MRLLNHLKKTRQEGRYLVAPMFRDYSIACVIWSRTPKTATLLTSLNERLIAYYPIFI